MQMRSVGRAARARLLAVIMVVAVALLLPIAPARAADTPVSISTQQQMYGKNYGFCFSGISMKAGSAPLKTVTASCSGSFTTSTSVASEIPLIATFFGPVTVTCPNGKVATTTLGNTGALFSLFLIPGANQTSSTASYKSPCPGDNFAFTMGVSSSSPMGVEWLFYVSAM